MEHDTETSRYAEEKGKAFLKGFSEDCWVVSKNRIPFPVLLIEDCSFGLFCRNYIVGD